MPHGLKLLILAGGVLITCVVCVMAFSITKRGKEQAMMHQKGAIKISESEELKQCDGVLMDGSRLIDLMKAYEKETIYFLVRTKECSTARGVFYNRDDTLSLAGAYSKQLSPLHEDYINESGSFFCRTVENENGILIGLELVQR